MSKPIRYQTRPKYPYSVFKPIKAGFMRHRVTIQRPVLSPADGQGGVTETWEDLGTVWANIQTLKDSAHANIEKFEEQQLKYQQHYSVMIRYGALNQENDLWTNMSNTLFYYHQQYTQPTVADRILFYAGDGMTKILQIIAVVTLDVEGWQTNMYAREGGNIG